ncbi:ABC transporter permease [Clostridium sp. MCC353]|uniref:ABC transporter permease n=1 Tax=Clostridium sp. MCC353 TaxID=2592646 RepID=UPI001C00B3F7|nr:ABC transporter permease [Clostridium sp. MCC353]
MKKDKYFVLKNFLFTMAIPIIVYCVMEVICRWGYGSHLINNSVDLKNLARPWIYAFCFAVGVSLNFFCGRFDFSAGAQMLFAVVIGGNLGLKISNVTGINAGACVLVFSALTGAVVGCVVGILFTRLRILPMTYGLGMAMILECGAFQLSNANGLSLLNVKGAESLSNLVFIVVTFAVVIAVMTYLFNYTTFGYEWRAIKGNQRIAWNSGINIFKNCALAYTIFGLMAGIAGPFDAAFKGAVTVSMDLGTVALISKNLFPLLLGMFIGRWSNMVVGIFAASLSINILALGLSKMGISQSSQTLVTYLLFVAFLIYNNSSSSIALKRKKRERAELARKTRMCLTASGQ